ncbi:dihydroneopterin aldolase [Aliiroseovarius sp. KMU-50]|uniref:dihydroneopterin aldolase n=1 Tax=Aliiroseovarius salicola TaxID=3009082 RepID=A0ABT4VZ79_9RHOB|nr:dihydroneopterin aldolase [Aliiroseovarius sp. KMU-50]MDA5093516.1 dihydroneopterin aldolase [Aliiroseovarius sp. KMU-50]
MTTEDTTAFQDLEARAIAMAGPNPPDRISVRDHTVEVEIGAFQAERNVTQRVRFSVVVEVAPSTGADTDDVDDILSYDAVTEAITAELEAERLNLLETLAERIADRILSEPQPLRVFVRIEKLDRGPGKLGVEIVRSRGSDMLAGVENTPTPLIIHLGNDAISSENLSEFLDRCAAHQVAVLLSVGQGSTPVPQTGESDTQRRVDLLAIEQNACALAAKDPRLKVVATRTELDWGLKNGQLSVWAPTKMVLDAVSGPNELDPQSLLTWLSGEINAVDTRIINQGGDLEQKL